jgi:putative membrane protein
MAKPFLNPESKAALAQAARDVEACSSAELVVAVRPRTGSYLHADLLAGIVAGVASTLALLVAERTFAPLWFVVDPLVIGVVAAVVASHSALWRRALTPAGRRRRRVEEAARATFVERRVHSTSGRTGVLLYVSVLEREAALVVDLAVEPLAATDGWRRAVNELETAVRDGADGNAVALRLRALGGLLAPALPCGAEDVNELPDEVC